MVGDAVTPERQGFWAAHHIPGFRPGRFPLAGDCLPERGRDLLAPGLDGPRIVAGQDERGDPVADDVRADQCQPAAEHLARAFGFLGKRWTAIILGHLSHGSVGFRDLSRGIGGISDSVLLERLADLAAGGLITRTVRDGPPVTVTYQLTERGRALMPALDQIAEWACDNLPPDKC